MTTKLNRPRPIDDLVPRPRLLKKLEAALRARLLLLSAPAGFGKSTLVAWWLNESPRIASAWLTLDEHDNTLAGFLGYWIASVEAHCPDTCERMRGIVAAAILPPPEVLAGILTEAMANLPDDLVLVLDDFHMITSPEILRMVDQFLQHQPPRLHLAILTRQDPALPLARLRVQQQLVDIRANDLRFRSEETAAFFQRTVGDALHPEVVALLEQRTEGWAAGLRIAALSMQDAEEPNTVARTLAGMQRHVMDFLMEQVLAQQPPALYHFLVHTSILDRLCAPLCDAMLDGAGIANGVHAGTERMPAALALRTLEASNLFLVPLDDDHRWYRYHPLFRDLLRHRLHIEAGRQEIGSLYRVAATWLEANGQVEEALHAWMAAGAEQEAAELVERQVATLLDVESNQVLQNWLNLLPASIAECRPVLLVARAWVHTMHSQLPAIPPLLHQAAAIQAHDTSSVPADLAIRLRSDIEALWCDYWFWNGQIERSMAHARDAIACLPEGDTLPRAHSLNILAFILNTIGRRYEALELLRDNLDREPPQSGTRSRLLLGLATTHFSAGNLHAAFQVSHEIIRLTRASNRANTLGWSHYLLGCIHLMWNEMNLAEEHFATAANMRYLVNAKMYQDSLHGLALVYADQGRHAEATASLEEALAFAVENLRPADATLTRAMQVRLALQRGTEADSLYWERPPLDYASGFWLEDPLLTYVRVLLARGTVGAMEEAADILDEMLAVTAPKFESYRLVEILLNYALLEYEMGRNEAALERLRRALTAAQGGNIVYPFREAGSRIDGLLRQLGAPAVNTAFARRLLETERTASIRSGPRHLSVIQQGDELVELLTEREREVLELLAQRLSDKEIAQALVISPLTVRKHTSNIFDKLQVHSRRQAVARAAAIGLLPAQVN